MNRQTCYCVIVTAIITVSCQTTTQVLSFSGQNPKLDKIGVTFLDKKQPVVDSLFPWLNKHYADIASNVTKKILNSDCVVLKEYVSYVAPDRQLIVDICTQNNLNGLLVSKIEFSKKIDVLYFVPIRQYYDHVLKMKLFDSNGNLVYNVSNETLHKNKGKVPTNENAISESVEKNIILISKIRSLK
jgi:hypothetical protein